MKRIKFAIACLRSQVVVQLTAKKWTKKRDARAKMLFAFSSYCLFDFLVVRAAS